RALFDNAPRSLAKPIFIGISTPSMHHSIGTWIMWGGMAGWILWAIAMIWPARRMRRISFNAAIAAPAERIWKAYCPDSGDPAYPPPAFDDPFDRARAAGSAGE